MAKMRHQLPMSERCEANARKLEEQADDPNNPDDPRWLKRMAGKWRARGAKKERALEHKLDQQPKKRSNSN